MVKFGWDKLKRFLAQANTWTGKQTFSNIAVTGGTISGATITETFTVSTNPALNAAVTTAIVDAYNGVVVTLSAAGNTQTLQNPTTMATIRKFMVINNDTSTHNLSVVAHSVTFTLTPGEGQCFLWDGSAWGPTDLGITEIPVKVTQGGTGLTTITDHAIMLGSGVGAVTPLTPLVTGEITVGVTGNDPKAVAAQTVASRKFLQQTGTGTAGQDPTWEALIPDDLMIPLATPPPIGGVTPAGGNFTAVNGLVLTAAAEGFTIAGGAAGAGAPTNFTEMPDGGTAIARTTDAESGTYAALLTADIAVGSRFQSNRIYNDSGFVGGQVVNLCVEGKYVTIGTILVGGYSCEIGADTYWYNFNTETWDIFTGTPSVTNYYLSEMDSWPSYVPMQLSITSQAAPVGAVNGKAIFMADSNVSGRQFYIDEFELLVNGTDVALNGGFENWSTANTRTLTVAENHTVGAVATVTDKGVTVYSGSAKALAGTDTESAMTPADTKAVLDVRIQQYYGVSWDESADTYVRTGSTAGQPCGVTLADAFLPVHRMMRGCVVANDGTVNYYLCATDWTKKEDGVTASKLDGTDGQVMVEIPKFWYRYGYLTTTHTWEVSPVPLTGFKVHEVFMSDAVEKDYLYVGAYEASLYDVSASKYVGQCYQTAVSAVFATADDSIEIATRTGWANALATGQKLVVSGTGSNNGVFTVATIKSATAITTVENLTDENAANTVIETETDVADSSGDKLCSVSGVCPITGGSVNGTRAHFRTWAENRGGGKVANDAAAAQWSQLYADANSALQLLYLTEYASFYSQAVLGYGIAVVDDWPAYNSSNPIAKTGNGNGTGNASDNTATAAITTGAGAAAVYLKYRGIENLYGHIWKFVDGYKINNNIPYLCNNFANFSDAENTDNYTNPTDINGAAITMHSGDGYQGTLELTGRGFFPASITGGDATHKITDYYYQAAGWLMVLSGGAASSGASDGVFFLNASNVLAAVYQYIGGRLCLRK